MGVTRPKRTRSYCRAPGPRGNSGIRASAPALVAERAGRVVAIRAPRGQRARVSADRRHLDLLPLHEGAEPDVLEAAHMGTAPRHGVLPGAEAPAAASDPHPLLEGADRHPACEHAATDRLAERVQVRRREPETPTPRPFRPADLQGEELVAARARALRNLVRAVREEAHRAAERHPLAHRAPAVLHHRLGRARDLPARPVPASALEDALVIRRGIPVVALRERPTFTPPALAGLRAGTGVAVVAGCPVGRRRAGRIAHLIADRAM